MENAVSLVVGGKYEAVDNVQRQQYFGANRVANLDRNTFEAGKEVGTDAARKHRWARAGSAWILRRPRRSSWQRPANISLFPTSAALQQEQQATERRERASKRERERERERGPSEDEGGDPHMRHMRPASGLGPTWRRRVRESERTKKASSSKDASVCLLPTRVALAPCFWSAGPEASLLTSSSSAVNRGKEFGFHSHSLL
ncbi:hypothetical protein ACLOJK_030026 [Asimina triloba]